MSEPWLKMVAYQTLWAVVALLLFLVKGSDSIILRRIGVPTYAVKGKEAVLTCDFDLEGQALYSVKWYKNGQEFFRYIPGRDDPIANFFRLGVNVDKEKSNERQVTLNDLSMKSTGRYRCEVSTEAPSFDTVSSFGDMIVVVLPERGPRISGGKDRYDVGDMVDVNCTSRNSKPAADLQWLVNDQPAESQFLVHYPIQNSSETSTRHRSSGGSNDRVNIMHTSTLGLRFRVQKRHFFKGAPASVPDFNPDDYRLKHTGMTLKCTASINTHDWQTVNDGGMGGMGGGGEPRARERLPSPKHRRALATYSENKRGYLSNYAPENIDGGAWPYHDSATGVAPALGGMVVILASAIYQQLSSKLYYLLL